MGKLTIYKHTRNSPVLLIDHLGIRFLIIIIHIRKPSIVEVIFNFLKSPIFGFWHHKVKYDKRYRHDNSIHGEKSIDFDAIY